MTNWDKKVEMKKYRLAGREAKSGEKGRECSRQQTHHDASEVPFKRTEEACPGASGREKREKNANRGEKRDGGLPKQSYVGRGDKPGFGSTKRGGSRGGKGRKKREVTGGGGK